MSRTIEEEYFGGVMDLGDPGVTATTLPYSLLQGGCRTFIVAPVAATRDVILPVIDSRYFPVGGEPGYIILNNGSSGGLVNVYDSAINLLVQLSIGQSARFFLVGYASGGRWKHEVRSSAVGTALPNDRIPIELTIEGTSVPIDLRTFLEREYDYNPTLPAAIRCHIQGIQGGDGSIGYSFRATGFPAGSLLTLVIAENSGVYGLGGLGGYGGFPSILPAAGSPGGDALYLDINTNIINNGTIAGGGGGGGGGSSSGGVGGAGGGGGAGFSIGQGGRGGPPGGEDGKRSTLLTGGAGGQLGFAPGGNGGSLGASGSAGNGGGGAAGRAIVRPAARTLTLVKTGTIIGANVTV